MRLLPILLLINLFSFGQNADWKELQGKIDSARTSATGIVTIDRNYTIDKPLIAAKWNGTDYEFFTIQIVGYATKWDVNGRSIIRATFNNAPILSIHKGKGVIVKGVNFQGPGWGRDSRYSPQACIAIDPFRYNLPPDGGYPTLQEWYRGKVSVSGSTGIEVENCTFNGTVIGLITSPNGYTLNAENCGFRKLRAYSVKYVIAGCQAQEKANKVEDLGAWGPSECVFYFNKYGAQQAGNWSIRDINIAGDVRSIIYRSSGGAFPIFIDDLFAESIEKIGYWQSNVGDAMNKASINFKHPKQMGYFTDSHMDGTGVTITNSTIRYYGDTMPVLFKGQKIPQDINNAGGLVNLRYDHEQTVIKQTGSVYGAVVESNTMTLPYTQPKGQVMFIMNISNWEVLGMGEVDSSWASGCRLRYVSKSITTGGNYRLGIKK